MPKERWYPDVCMTVTRNHIQLFVLLRFLSFAHLLNQRCPRSPSRLLFRFPLLLRAFFSRIDVFIIAFELVTTGDFSSIATPSQMCYGPSSFTRLFLGFYRTFRTLLSCLPMFSPSFHRYLAPLIVFPFLAPVCILYDPRFLYPFTSRFTPFLR